MSGARLDDTIDQQIDQPDHWRLTGNVFQPLGVFTDGLISAANGTITAAQRIRSRVM